MGSLVPGWDSPKHEPDFREMSKPEEPEVPEWLQQVRSMDSERDAKDTAAKKGPPRRLLNRTSLGRTSLNASPLGSPDAHSNITSPLQRFSSQFAASPTAPRSIEEIVKQVPVEPIDWWKRVDSSGGNCKPDAEKPENYRSGNYVPQFDVATQHHNAAHHGTESEVL